VNPENNLSVLAIGLDAAEPSYVRGLIETGHLPTLERLLSQGKWIRVGSPAGIGSGCVWPSFMTGTGPATHGVYGEWAWQPESMTVKRFGDDDSFSPFWKALDNENVSVGVVDVPLSPLVNMRHGFQVNELGPHDVFLGRVTASPPDVTELLNRFPAHPFYREKIEVDGPEDVESLLRLSAACINGAQLRGELARKLICERQPQAALIVFPEVHHSAHYFWHCVDSNGELQSGRDRTKTKQVESCLPNIYSEIDRQIGKLIEARGDDCVVMVFSLHGMRSTAGVVDFLDQLLCEKGFAQTSGWKNRSWRDWLASALAFAKRHTPAPLKRFYYENVSQRATKLIAGPTMMRPYDWSATRAFSLPSDQNGWIRLNLKGREAAGIVLPEQYETTCQQVEEMLRGLVREDGKPLVRDVIRIAADSEEARAIKLPDLIVQWEDAAHGVSSRIKDSAIKIRTTGNKYTGQHTTEGFCILKGVNGSGPENYLRTEDFQGIIAKLISERGIPNGSK
jgi:predicted AlkP superfamily phosphohydrolase/phosphomutase